MCLLSKIKLNPSVGLSHIIFYPILLSCSINYLLIHLITNLFMWHIHLTGKRHDTGIFRIELEIFPLSPIEAIS